MNTYSAEERQLLLNICHGSIKEGLTNKRPLKIRAFDYDKNLRKRRACFVTLKKKEALRGCMGSIQPLKPLVVDAANNAFSAAFRDSRFPGLTAEEYEECSLSISVLSLPESMEFDSEDDLIRQLRPGIDGLILTEGDRCGVFLPLVWEKLPTAKLFLAHLKNKAGLPNDYWSNTLQVERYTTSLISEPSLLADSL
jgi:AmmeMemoRadiSam system protein A